MFLLVFGFILDSAISFFVQIGFSFQLPFDMPIGLIISIWIVVTESISICENIERMGVPLPEVVVKVLRSTKDKIEGEKAGR